MSFSLLSDCALPRAIAAALVSTALPLSAAVSTDKTGTQLALNAPVAVGGASPINRLRPVRIPLDAPLTVNGKFAGSITIAVDPKGDGEVDARRLIELLSPVIEPTIKVLLVARIAGRSRVDFTDLAIDGFSVAFDTLTLSVAATLSVSASATSSVRIAPREAMPNPASFDPAERFSAGVNVSATQRYVHSQNGGFEPVHADFDGIANFGGFEGYTLTGGVSYRGAGWERREIRLTHDIFETALRVTAGEFTPGSTSFQGSGHILGIGLERAYSTIQPFQNTRPIGRQNFTLERDSSVDVIVNQVRVQTIRLGPGRYDIGDFPFAAGPNQVQLVVDDVGGKREIVNFDVFSSSGLLAPGTTEFSGAMGVRETGQLHYGLLPAATGYGFRGISDNLTLGLNGQATSRAAQGGAVAILGTGLGFFQLETAASDSFGNGFGLAMSLDYRGEFSIRTPKDLRLSASSVYRSARFQDAFSIGSRSQQALQSSMLVQWQAPWNLSLGLGYSLTKSRRPSIDTQRLDATFGRSFGRFGISGTVSRSTSVTGGGNDIRGAIGLSLRLGSRYQAGARYDSGTHRQEIEVGRSSDGQLDDISGDLRYTEDREAKALAGRLAYINNRFDLVVNHNRLESIGLDGRTTNVSDWNVSSFFGYSGGSFAVGRSVKDGFIIAPVHSSLNGAQASIMSGDRVVARSGLFGPALIPINRAYGINRYDVKVDPLPVGYDLGAGTINLFPGYGSGYKATIGSDASHIAVGILVNVAGPVSLVGGLIEPTEPARLKTWKERTFFTNRTGRFVADRLEPGRYRLVLDGHTAGEFVIPAKSEGLIDVGTVRAGS